MRALLIAVVVASAGATLPAAAQVAPGGTDAVHVVDPGDTLWDLARRYLNDPFQWPEIYAANRDLVADPDLIYPEARLRIPGRATQSPDQAQVEALGGAPAPRSTAGRTVFFGGSEASAQSTSRVADAAGVAAVAVVPSGSFYAAGVLVPDAEIEVVGTLVEVVSPTVIPLQDQPQIQPYDRVYMTVEGPVAVGDRLQLLRPDREIEPFGRIHISTGLVRVVAVEGTVATVEVGSMFDKVAVGDIAVPMPGYEPRAETPIPSGGLDGVLLALETPQPIAAREDIAYLNLGIASGVVEGDEFVVYIPETEADWGTRPAEDVATVQVVRAELLTSAVRIVSVQHPAIEPGLPVRLVGKMPE